MRLDVAALLAAFSNPAYVAAREVLHFLGKNRGAEAGNTAIQITTGVIR
jgi:hypothetical protein